MQLFHQFSHIDRRQRIKIARISFHNGMTYPLSLQPSDQHLYEYLARTLPLSFVRLIVMKAGVDKGFSIEQHRETIGMEQPNFMLVLRYLHC